jgi:uncharacterized membrane-anchored protein YitT (DUF2179 family)
MGGLLAGVGLLVLFRHQASLGGINVLVLYLQERYGLRAGVVQLCLDALILAASIPTISFRAVAISLLGAAVLNLTLAINHKPGRYMAILGSQLRAPQAAVRLPHFIACDIQGGKPPKTGLRAA